MIQAIVPPHLFAKYVIELSAGDSYVMQNFKVSKNDFSFRSTTHCYKLVFCGSTSVKKLDLPEIPVNYVKILSLTSILEGSFESKLLFGTYVTFLYCNWVYSYLLRIILILVFFITLDVVGGVKEISQSQILGDNSKNKVVFTLTDARYVITHSFHVTLSYVFWLKLHLHEYIGSKLYVQCTLWGQLAVQFYEYYRSHGEEGNIVILLENARIKGAQGICLSLSTLSSIHILLWIMWNF